MRLPAMRRFAARLAAMLLVPAVFALSPALASDTYTGLAPVPACQAQGVLADIVDKAAYRGQAPYQQPVAITGFDRISQTRYADPAAPGLRTRRWCQARAHLAGGSTAHVYYLIESHASFVGVNYGVESCIVGRDMWNVHGGDCSAVRIW